MSDIRENCDTCLSFAKLPKNEDHMEPTKMPDHTGSHVNVDILKRSKQNIIVCTDMFSGFTTATFIPNETKDTLQHALVQVITPIRNHQKS